MNTFYQEHKLLIWFILISGLLLTVFHIWDNMRKPRFPKPLNEETEDPVIVDGDALTSDDDTLFREVVKGLMREMRSATSKAEIETLYWEIEHAEDDFRNRVSPGYLKIYIDWLYDIQATERDRIASGKLPSLALG